MPLSRPPPPPAALQAVATSVQRAVAVAGSEVPISRGAVEGILIKHVLEPGRCSLSRLASNAILPLISPKGKPPPGAGGCQGGGVSGRGSPQSCSQHLLQGAPGRAAKLGMSRTPQPPVRSWGPGAEAAA